MNRRITQQTSPVSAWKPKSSQPQNQNNQGIQNAQTNQQNAPKVARPPPQVPQRSTQQPPSKEVTEVEDTKEIKEIKQKEEIKIQQKQQPQKQEIEQINGKTNGVNTTVIDTISNKLREGIDEVINNLTHISMKTVELEKRNDELQKQIENIPQSNDVYTKLLERINALEVQNKDQQKLINNLSVKIDGYSKTKSKEKDEWVKEDKERVEQMMHQMKMTQQEMTKKEMELKKRKEEAEKYVKEQQKMRNEVNSIKKDVTDNKTEIVNQRVVVGMNQEKIDYHDDQINQIWDEMKNRQKEMENQINANQSLNPKERQMMKDQIYWELVEETMKMIEEKKEEQNNENEKSQESLIERVGRIEKQMTQQSSQKLKNLEERQSEIERTYLKKIEIKELSQQHWLQNNNSHLKQLEAWTQKKYSEIVFDSVINDWNTNTSDFVDRIIGKKQLVFFIESEDGEKFGYYLNTKVVEKYVERIETDFKSLPSKSFSATILPNSELISTEELLSE